MNASKRLGELQVSLIAQKSRTKFTTTRFGNVLESSGSVIPLFKKQIENGGPLTVTHREITRFFMTISEACQLVLEAGSMASGGEIFVFDMGNPIKIYELAVNMIRLSGYKYPDEINIEFIGMRPGEKLHEELWTDKENTIRTYKEKILIHKSNINNFNELKGLFKDLEINSKPNNESNIVQIIKEIIPEFKSDNSRYKNLHKKPKVI